MRPFLRDGMTVLVHGYSNVVCTGTPISFFLFQKKRHESKEEGVLWCDASRAL
jgi:hypothetical protein